MQNKVIKYSRQREAIREFLISRKDHPTAETIYEEVRKQYPRISLGTVYRNLSLLTELEQAVRIPSSDGFDHFDGNPEPHYHFICDSCRAIIDLPMPLAEELNRQAGSGFEGIITGHTAFFYGLCGKCKRK